VAAATTAQQRQEKIKVWVVTALAFVEGLIVTVSAYRLGPVPALAICFENPPELPKPSWVNFWSRFGFKSNRDKLPLYSTFLVERFAGQALWILADPDRDAFLGDDTENVVDAERGSGKLSIGRTPAATPDYLATFPMHVGFSWDGYLLLSGDHDRSELPDVAQAWLASRDDMADSLNGLGNMVAAEACYPHAYGEELVWVPRGICLDEAERLIE
jgi:hypothetical protein